MDTHWSYLVQAIRMSTRKIDNSDDFHHICIKTYIVGRYWNCLCEAVLHDTFGKDMWVLTDTGIISVRQFQ